MEDFEAIIKEYDRLLRNEAKAQEKYYDWQAKRVEAEKKLREACTCDYTRTNKVEYEEGSYYDRETWTTYSICTMCGKKHKVKVESGGYG